MVDSYPERIVHVLTVRQDDPAVRARLDGYRRLLDAEELTREARFHFEADQERFVIGRTLARLQLSRFLGGDPRRWRFVTNEHGRPELVEPPGPRTIGFNVSHTHGLIACAIASTWDVGVDVEWVDRTLTHDIADRFFAPREVADLRALPTDDQTARVLRLLDPEGGLHQGARHGPGAAAHRLRLHAGAAERADDRLRAEIHDRPETWQFAQSWPTPAHRLAVAVRRAPGCDVEVRIENIVPEVHG